MRRPQTVNFNTLSLGREGYLSLTRVTDDAPRAVRPAAPKPRTEPA